MDMSGIVHTAARIKAKSSVKTKTKVYPDTVLLNFPLCCPECKQETKVNVVKLKMVVSDEADDK